jgi:hypothetical protein
MAALLLLANIKMSSPHMTFSDLGATSKALQTVILKVLPGPASKLAFFHEDKGSGRFRQ